MPSNLVVATCPCRSGARLLVARFSVVGALLMTVATGCLSEPSGPFGHHLTLMPQGLSFGALGDTARLSALELGPGATPLPTPAVAYWSPSPSVATVDSTGLVTSRGNGVTWIAARAPSGEIDSVPVTVVQLPSRVVAVGDTLRFESLGAVQSLGATVVDRLGAAIAGLSLEYSAVDTSIATVTNQGQVHARRNGVTLVQVRGAGDSLQIIILVQQRAVRVVTRSDSLHFVALGDIGVVDAVPIDSLGSPLLGAGVDGIEVLDTTVLKVLDSVTVRANGNGHTIVRFSSAGLPVELPATVSQAPDTIAVSVTDTSPILSLPLGASVPVTCRPLDRNGYAVPIAVMVDASEAGRWTGTTCGDLHVQSSGIETMVFRAGSLATLVSVALAVRPVVSSPAGEYLDLDSLPVGVLPWAPTLWRSPSGEWQLFFAGYEPDNSSLSGFRGHLLRLASSDGSHFRYDGLVLQHDDVDCAPNGSGIENIAVVPRSDGPGWRMYYASGSFACYGWQVFSAVSSDARTWTKETGIRVDNGSVGSGAAPWPVGEGMVVDRLATGEWRMIVGGYRRVQPVEDKFHIVEWRSADQLHWTYAGPILTTDQLPATGQRSVYSPTVREFAPGLWRMLFTADDRNVPGGRSRIWSAVSTDQAKWQLEGEIMGAVGTDLFYTTLLDDRLVFIRKDTAQNQRLATATVAMP